MYILYKIYCYNSCDKHKAESLFFHIRGFPFNIMRSTSKQGANLRIQQFFTLYSFLMHLYKKYMEKQVKYQHLQSLTQLCFKFLSHRCLLKCNKLPNGQLQVKIFVINMFLNRVCENWHKQITNLQINVKSVPGSVFVIF